MKTTVPFYARVFLFLYSLIILSAVSYLSVRYGAANILNKEKWLIIGISVLLIEALNQFTFHTASKWEKLIYLRGILFWIIFTISAGYYIFLISKIETGISEIDFKWNEIIVRAFVVLASSAYLPFYSFCTNVRFLFLFGKFQKNS